MPGASVVAAGWLCIPPKADELCIPPVENGVGAGVELCCPKGDEEAGVANELPKEGAAGACEALKGVGVLVAVALKGDALVGVDDVFVKGEAAAGANAGGFVESEANGDGELPIPSWGGADAIPFVESSRGLGTPYFLDNFANISASLPLYFSRVFATSETFCGLWV